MPSIIQIRQQIENFKSIPHPTIDEVLTPDYLFYGHAPFWCLHQAICLLAGVAVLDRETFNAIIHMREIQIDINRALQKRGMLRANDKLSEREHFAEYLMIRFPIPYSNLDYIKNIKEALKRSIDDGSLTYTLHKENEIKIKLLDPNDVIFFAQRINIEIHETLQISIKNRSTFNLLRLPKYFPDSINFYNLYSARMFEYRRSLPLSPAALMPLSSFDSYSAPINQMPNSQSQEEEPWATLCDEELNYPLSQLIFAIICSPRSKHLNEKGILQLKATLQKLAPCPPTVFQQTLWNPQEAALIYYSIDPHFLENNSIQFPEQAYIIYETLSILDRKEKVWHNFLNYLKATNNGKVPEEITQNIFLEFLKEKNYPIPSSFRNETSTSLNQAPVTQIRRELKEKPLSPLGKKLFDFACNSRKDVLTLALEDKYPNKKERDLRQDLIHKFGTPDPEEFKKYQKKSPDEETFRVEQRCRALAQFLLQFEPDLTISLLRQHKLMEKFCGRHISNFKPRTFSSWMHKEGIRDRENKDSF